MIRHPRSPAAVVSALLVVAALFTLLAVPFARDDHPTTPCPPGRSPAPSPGRCPVIVVTTLPSPRVVTTVVTVEPPAVDVRPGPTTIIVRPAPTTRPTPTPARTPAPSRTPSPSRTPTPCPLPTLPVLGCPVGGPR